MKRKIAKKTNIAKKACQQVQLYAKLSETDEHGNGFCCSCGMFIPWQKSNGGHWQPKGRTYNAACIIEENVHFQCCTCNLYMQGNPAGYSVFMNKNYSKFTLDKILQASYTISDRQELQDVYDKYKAKNKILAKSKSFKVNIP